MSVNSYGAQFATPISAQSGGLASASSALTNYRSLTIVTDTLQSAMNIARTKVRHAEVVISVALLDTDVVVDTSAISDDD